MAILVTGGAGFVATTLISRLMERGEQLIAIDNLRRGSVANIPQGDVQFFEADLADLKQTRVAFLKAGESAAITEVWHLAANSDIPAGTRDPDVDFRDTFLTTFNTVRVMEEMKIRQLFFSSSSAVYGDHQEAILSETTGPLLPISNYGAMKLASEAFISAASERFLERALVFRFPNVVGLPPTHGVILDFVTRLRANPALLQVLGDGNQQKLYLHVQELVDAMLFLHDRCSAKLDVFNIGPHDDGISVREIATAVVRTLAPQAQIYFERDKKGWVGDVPRFRYCVTKLEALGWRTTFGSRQAVERAVQEIVSKTAGSN